MSGNLGVRGLGRQVQLAAVLIASLWVAVTLCAAQPSPNQENPTTIIDPAAPSPEPSPAPSPDITDAFTVVQTYGLTGRLAFSANLAGRDHLFLLDLDARRVRNLVFDFGNNSYPSWSPGGEQLAFVSDRDGNKEIYLAHWDGSNIRRLTRDPAVDDHPSFADDGKRIAYISGAGSGSEAKLTNIFSLDVASGVRTQITNLGGRNSTPRWSPDGRYISYTTDRFWPGWDVCLWDTSARSERCILQGRATYCRAAWSRSGKQLVYSFGLLKQIQLGIVDLPGGDESALTESAGRDYDPVWAADDSWVIFSGERERSGIFNIFAVSLKDRKTLPLLTSPHSIRHLSWSPTKTLTLEARRIMEEERRRDAQGDAALPSAALSPPPPPPSAPATPVKDGPADDELVPF